MTYTSALLLMILDSNLKKSSNEVPKEKEDYGRAEMLPISYFSTNLFCCSSLNCTVINKIYN